MKIPINNIEKFNKSKHGYTIYYPTSNDKNIWINEAIIFVPLNNNALLIHYHLRNNGGGFEGIKINWNHTFLT